MTRSQRNVISRRNSTAKRARLGICRRCTRKAILPTQSCAFHQLKERLTQIQRKYGLTYSEYQELTELYGGRCHICLEYPRVVGLSNTDPHKISRSLTVDHDHKTGRVRGLVCPKCNFGLGHFKDNPELLRKTIDYLGIPNG